MDNREVSKASSLKLTRSLSPIGNASIRAASTATLFLFKPAKPDGAMLTPMDHPPATFISFPNLEPIDYRDSNKM